MKTKRLSVILTIPLVLFTLFFILGPLVYLVVLSFSTNKGVTGVEFIFTFSNYIKVFDGIFKKILIDSVILGLLTTFLVALLGYPFGYFLARCGKKEKEIINALLMIPFWVSSLLRLYGWIVIFRSNGILDKVLMFLKITDAPLKLLYTRNATIVGMVYALLPFMIFSVYSSAEKLDWSLVEASRDLGATAFQSFKDISFKLTLSGLFSGVILTFIPSMGLVFIAELLGGNKVVLVGNLISEQATTAHNLPFATALAVILMLITGIFMIIYRKIFKLKDLEGLM